MPAERHRHYEEHPTIKRLVVGPGPDQAEQALAAKELLYGTGHDPDVVRPSKSRIGETRYARSICIDSTSDSQTREDARYTYVQVQVQVQVQRAGVEVARVKRQRREPASSNYCSNHASDHHQVADLRLVIVGNHLSSHQVRHLALG